MATSTLLYETKSVLWRIPNFAELCKSDELLEQQCLKFEMSLGNPLKDFPTLKWECALETDHSDKEKDQDCVLIYIYLLELPDELSNCRSVFQFHVVGDTKEGYQLNCGFTAAMDRFKGGCGPMDSLPGYSKILPYLTSDGALEMSVVATVFLPDVQDAALRAEHLHYDGIFRHTFATQLNGIREEPLNIISKATKLVSKDRVEFSVDPVILAARSPVFCGMFQHGVKEAQTGVADVNDMDSKPLEVLLHFIHKAELRRNWRDEGVIEGLVYGANKYEIWDLEDFLNQVLGLVCTDENCGKLMSLAKSFELKKAQKLLMEYFQKNLANDVDKVLKFADDTKNTAMQMSLPESEHQELENGEQPPCKKTKLDPRNCDHVLDSSSNSIPPAAE